jgi:hypothetical protein
LGEWGVFIHDIYYRWKIEYIKNILCKYCYYLNDNLQNKKI